MFLCERGMLDIKGKRAKQQAYWITHDPASLEHVLEQHVRAAPAPASASLQPSHGNNPCADGFVNETGGQDAHTHTASEGGAGAAGAGSGDAERHEAGQGHDADRQTDRQTQARRHMEGYPRWEMRHPKHVPAPVCRDDWQRLALLHRLQVLDTPPEECFDRITRRAAELLNVPIALISLVDSDRQWFKSSVGLRQGMCELERDVAFCSHTIHPEQDERIFVVPDALEDERFRYSDVVVGYPHVRFYAGVPLEYQAADPTEQDDKTAHDLAPQHCPKPEAAPAKARLGTLCIIDTQARVLSERERETLLALARLAEAELGVRQTLVSQVSERNRRSDYGLPCPAERTIDAEGNRPLDLQWRAHPFFLQPRMLESSDAAACTIDHAGNFRSLVDE